MRILFSLLTAGILVCAAYAGQSAPAQNSGANRSAPRAGAGVRRPAKLLVKNPGPKTAAGKKFVLDVVQMAVALPQPDPQDRLRVLTSAATVVSPFSRKLALGFAREGTRIEADLLANGQTPAVSMLSSGQVDCPSAINFVESLPAAQAPLAQDSIVGAISACGGQAAEAARLKLETSLNSGVLAVRPLLALIERSGPKSAWSQRIFQKTFSSLPSDAGSYTSAAPDIAAMFDRMASESDKDIARDTGLRFLEWLGNMKPSGERTLAASVVSEDLQKLLGKPAYDDALSSNARAQAVASAASSGNGPPPLVEMAEEENASVLEALDNARSHSGQDRSDSLRSLKPSMRARQAAADGFALATSGDRKIADHYFDIAYAAVDEVWGNRSSEKNATAIAEEVSEAAAHVDAVSALQRAQRLQDPSAQAISMLTVARVAASR